MLSHKTEYSINGGSSWVLHTNSEPVGPGKIITVSGLAPGTYDMLIKITPTTGDGPPMISNPFQLVVSTRLLGDVASSASLTGNLTTGIQVAASAQGTAFVTGRLPFDMEGNVSASSAVTGNLKMKATLAGDIAGQGTLAAPGDLYTHVNNVLPTATILVDAPLTDAVYTLPTATVVFSNVQ